MTFGGKRAGMAPTCHNCGAPLAGADLDLCPACRRLTRAALVAFRDYLAATLELEQRATGPDRP